MKGAQVFPAELVGLTLLALAYLLLLAEPLSDATLLVANVVGPALLVAILGTGVVLTARRLAFPVLAPCLWLRIAIGAYFGFGAVFAALVTGEVRQFLEALHPFDGEMLLRLNLLNTVGTAATLAGIASLDRLAAFSLGAGSAGATVAKFGGAAAARRVARVSLAAAGRSPEPPRPRAVAHWLEQSETLRIAFLWLCIGLPWLLMVELPNAFGLFEVVVPGALNQLALARLAGYALLLASRSGRWANVRLWTWLVWAADLSLSLAIFAKTNTLMLVFAVVLSRAMRGPSIKGMALAVLTLLAVHAAIRPIVDYGRERVVERYGSLRGAGLEERMGYVAEALAGARARTLFDQEASWAFLLRFSYANAQALVVSRYDQGNPGDSGSAEELLTLLVPRILWPDKPIVSDEGRDLYTLATGSEGTSIAAGVFAEAYWNGGWPYVVLWSWYMGLVVGALGRFARSVLVTGRPLQLPVVLSSVLLSTRPDGWFGLSYVGGAATIALAALLTAAIERVLAKRSRQHGVPTLPLAPRIGPARMHAPKT